MSLTFSLKYPDSAITKKIVIFQIVMSLTKANLTSCVANSLLMFKAQMPDIYEVKVCFKSRIFLAWVLAQTTYL